jgi:hypothetical protein
LVPLKSSDFFSPKTPVSARRALGSEVSGFFPALDGRVADVAHAGYFFGG